MPTEGMEDDDLKALKDKWAPIDNDTRILTLEFMRGGDMHNLIKKLAKTKDSVPQPVLWRIFFCRESVSRPAHTDLVMVRQAWLTLSRPSQPVVRGCISMYSPPRSLTRRADGKVVPAQQLRELFGPDLDEALVEPVQGSNRPPPAWNFVHYDLDPQNGNMVPISVPLPN